MLPSWVFKRIVPPRAELLRPYAFTFFFLVLDGLFKEGIPYGEVYLGYYLRRFMVSLSREPGMKSKLDQHAYK
jgi:hypothetical protein